MTILSLRNTLNQSALFKKEYLALLLNIIFFICFPSLIREVDVTAAPVDPGILSVLILAMFAVILFKAATWGLIRMIWPALATYSSESFEQDFNSLKPIYKVCIYLSFYLCLLFLFILAMWAIL